MPLYKRQPLQKKPNNDSLKDSDQIFYCKHTKEIFDNYEEYVQRIMLLNSTVWSCEITKRPNLTYAEALESEKKSRTNVKSIPKTFKLAVIMIAKQSKCTGLHQLLDDIVNYTKNRYFVGETVRIASEAKKKKSDFRVFEVIHKDKSNTNPEAYQYKLQNEVDDSHFMIVDSQELYRPKSEKVSRDQLKNFLQNYTYLKYEMVRVKDEGYNKITENEKYKWSDIFVGDLPKFDVSKRYLELEQKEREKENKLKENEQKKKIVKQSDISKYLTKSDDNNQVNKKPNGKINNIVKETPKEREEREKLEKERIRIENAKIQQIIRKFNIFPQEDLELRDLRPISKFNPVNTLIPIKYFGEFVMILEFMHSFADILAIKYKFPGGITMDILERALILREYNGPINDIFQVLLNTIFSLQLEEDGECEISYVQPKDMKEELKYTKIKNEAILQANKTTGYSSKYFGSKLPELPMDTNTVSEILRLHLLSSGAKVDDRCHKWRILHRNGYSSVDDPGLTFKIKYPHIIRLLRTHTVSQLPLSDILKIIKCLIDQIMTYSSVRDIIEERIELSSKAKMNLRMAIQKERKRKIDLANKKKELTDEKNKKIEELQGSQEEKEFQKSKIERQLESELSKLDLTSAKDAKNYLNEINECKRNIFAYQIHLGSDRAFRNYWLFESLPGIFIEHDTTISGKCLDHVVENIPGLANCTTDQRYKYIKDFIKLNIQPENGKTKLTIDEAADISKLSVKCLNSEEKFPSPSDLLMCTTEHRNCPIHSESFPGRVKWSYIHTEEELEALLNSLNPLGLREKILRENIELEKPLILDHIKNCPNDKLSIDPSQKDQILNDLIKNMKQYSSAADQIGMNTKNITDLLLSTIRENVLELSDKIISGGLGNLKVKNRILWREAIDTGSYDPQCENLVWGSDVLKSGADSNDTEIIHKNIFEDPGLCLGNTTDIESEDSSDEDFLVYTPDIQKQIRNYCSALLQIKQGIEQKYFKFPFAPTKTSKIPQSKCDKISENFEISLMESTNFSQFFLHYNILYDSIMWSKSADRAYCRICRKRNEPEKMLLCDNCNGGHHMHCLKPKIKVIPEGDWFCPKCAPKPEPKKRKPRVVEDDYEENNLEMNNEYEEDIEPKEQSEEEEEVDDDPCCKICEEEEDNDMAICNQCPFRCHINCHDPPLRKAPRNWTCQNCIKKSSKNVEKKKNKKKSKKSKNKKSRKIVYYTVDNTESEDNSDIEDNNDENNLNSSEDEEDTDFQQKRKRKREKKKNDSDQDEDSDVSSPKRKKKKSNKKKSFGKKHHKKQYDSNDEQEEDDETMEDEDNFDENNGADDSDFEIKPRKRGRSAKSNKNHSKSKHNSSQYDENSSSVDDNDAQENEYEIKSRKRGRKPKNRSKYDENSLSGDENDNDDDDLDTENEFQPRKRGRPSNSDKSRKSRSSLHNGDYNENEDSEPNTIEHSSKNRRSRTSDLPLHTVILYSLLNEISKHEDSWPFNRPVTKHEVPDYYDIIKIPMDFAKIKSRLNMAHYNSDYDIMSDIQQVFINCDIYNTSESEIYKAGIRLEKFIQKRCKELDLPFRPSEMILGDTDIENNKSERNGKLKMNGFDKKFNSENNSAAEEDDKDTDNEN